MKALHTLLFCSVLSLLALPISGQAQVRTFSASAGGTLDLRLEAGGSVSIIGGASEVRVEVTRSGRDADEISVTFDQSGDRVTVRSEFDSRGRHNANVKYEIRVPSRFNVDLESTGGSVDISGVSGTFEGQTMGGGIDLSDVSGSVDMQTMGGAISVSNSELEGKLHTMGGNIELEDVRGSVEATTMGGNVRHRGSGSSSSAIKVQTMGGNVEIGDAPAGADLQTMGGDITAGNVGSFFEAETMGGDIDVSSVDGWIEAKTMGGSVTIAMTGGTSGDRHVSITSMGGDIELRVPQGLSMKFDIEVEVEGRGKDASDYVIESDFALDVSAPQRSSGGRRTQLKAQGTTAGGSNLIWIRTVNGDVRILSNR
ncbi:MAG: DUF4097 and DUF4098 domain-containing protein YvlB [Rhodothermales bacterium]|jgi:DUF4097 and DUF4098 domain-containing protein YvlB